MSVSFGSSSLGDGNLENLEQVEVNVERGILKL